MRPKIPKPQLLKSNLHLKSMQKQENELKAETIDRNSISNGKFCLWNRETSKVEKGTKTTMKLKRLGLSG